MCHAALQVAPNLGTHLVLGRNNSAGKTFENASLGSQGTTVNLLTLTPQRLRSTCIPLSSHLVQKIFISVKSDKCDLHPNFELV